MQLNGPYTRSQNQCFWPGLKQQIQKVEKTTDIFKCKAILLPRLASFSYQNSFTNVTSSMFNAFPIDNDTDINREIWSSMVKKSDRRNVCKWLEKVCF